MFYNELLAAQQPIEQLACGLVPFLIPAVFLGLGLIVCLIQAFVFSLLTMIYIGLALQEAH